MIRDPVEIFVTFLAVMWRRRVLFAVPVVAMPLIGLAASFFVSRQYEARTTLLVQEPSKLNPFLNDLAIGPNVKDRMPALNALLHSEHVLDKVLNDVGSLPPGTTPRDRDMMIARVSAATTVKLIGNDLIELKITDRNPGGLLKMLEAVSRRFVERLLSPENSAIVDSQTFLDGQLHSRREALERAESEFASFKARNADKLPAIYAANVTRLGGLQQKTEERAMELAAAEAAFEDMRNRLASTDPVIGRLEETIVQVKGELTSLRARYTDEHSEVQAAERRLSRLESERTSLIEASRALKDTDIDRLWNMAAGSTGLGADKSAPGFDKAAPLLVSQMLRLQEAQAKRVTLRQDVEQLKKTVQDLQTTMAEFAPIEREHQNLERAVATARETYEVLSKRYEMARVTGALGKFEAPERIKVIDPPVEPTTPVSPGPGAFTLAGLIAGLALGAGLAFLAELMDQRVRTTAALEAFGTAPVLARLPSPA